MKSIVLISSGVLAVGGCATAPVSAIAARVDHVIVRVTDPTALHTFLTQTLALPEAWPVRSYGFFVSGGVLVGNTSLEVLRMGGSDPPTPRLFGIAFEPVGSMDASLRTLADRGVEHGSPMPFRGTQPDGTAGVLWTNASLPGLGVPNTWLFLCEYGFDVETKRRRLRADLNAREGGPLGLVGVKEIMIGAQDPDAAKTRWRAHFGPPSEAGEEPIWRFVSGPAIRLVRAERGGLVRTA